MGGGGVGLVYYIQYWCNSSSTCFLIVVAQCRAPELRAEPRFELGTLAQDPCPGSLLGTLAQYLAIHPIAKLRPSVFICQSVPSFINCLFSSSSASFCKIPKNTSWQCKKDHNWNQRSESLRFMGVKTPNENIPLAGKGRINKWHFRTMS